MCRIPLHSSPGWLRVLQTTSAFFLLTTACILPFLHHRPVLHGGHPLRLSKATPRVSPRDHRLALLQVHHKGPPAQSHSLLLSLTPSSPHRLHSALCLLLRTSPTPPTFPLPVPHFPPSLSLPHVTSTPPPHPQLHQRLRFLPPLRLPLPAGILTRWQWMRAFLAQHAVTSIASFAATHFIDCVTCLLDALFSHLPWLACTPAHAFSPPSKRSASLCCAVRPASSSLSLTTVPLATPLLVHLSGELLHSHHAPPAFAASCPTLTSPTSTAVSASPPLHSSLRDLRRLLLLRLPHSDARACRAGGSASRGL